MTQLEASDPGLQRFCFPAGLTGVDADGSLFRPAELSVGPRRDDGLLLLREHD